MRSLILLTATIVLLQFSAYSQNDSTRLDLGGTVMNRAFTQTVSIKGTDLEKMPFVNLSEAINVWLSGAYTTTGNITYVVDGNYTSDVNSYSIYDIEEVVLVQNALAGATTAGTQQQLVLITTRKGKGKSGFQAAAQTFLVHSPKASTNLYHQYYVGAYRNLEKLSLGFSANYLRDAQPISEQNGIKAITPSHIDRWRLNGYLVWRPDAKNTVEAHVGFTPQTQGAEVQYGDPGGSGSFAIHNQSHQSANLLLPWARWHGEWLPGLRNDLQAGYATTLQKGNAWEQDSYGPGDPNNQYSEMQAQGHADHLYFRDRLSYAMVSGGWTFEPSLNTSYEYVTSHQDATAVYQKGADAGPGNTNIGNTQITNSASASSASRKVWLLTPTVDLRYKQRLDLQGGIVADVSDKSLYVQAKKKVYPFASLGVEVLPAGGAAQHNSLKIFGSYAQQGSFMFNSLYRLNDFGSTNSVFSGSGGLVNPVNIGGTVPVVTPVYFPYDKQVTYWNWQTGVRYAGKDDRWQLSYTFSRTNFTTIGGEAAPGGGTDVVYSEWRSSQHFLGLQVRVADGQTFSWRTGLTGTIIKNKTNTPADYYYAAPLGQFVETNHKTAITGGWTNRLRCKDLTFGVDMLYQFNREIAIISYTGPITYSHTSPFVLQNIYVGYNLHLHGNTGLEIYADGRGIVRSDKLNVLDTRRYYGIGGKLTI